MQLYHTALQAQPGHAPTLVNMASLCVRAARDYDQGEQLFRKVGLLLIIFPILHYACGDG